MQRVEMLRVGGKHGAVECVGLDEAPLSVQRQRLFDGMRRIRARGGVLGHACVSQARRSTSIRQGRPRWLTEGKFRRWIPGINRTRHQQGGGRQVESARRMSVGSISFWQQDQNFWSRRKPRPRRRRSATVITVMANAMTGQSRAWRASPTRPLWTASTPQLTAAVQSALQPPRPVRPRRRAARPQFVGFPTSTAPSPPPVPAPATGTGTVPLTRHVAVRPRLFDQRQFHRQRRHLHDDLSSRPGPIRSAI